MLYQLCEQKITYFRAAIPKNKISQKNIKKKKKNSYFTINCTLITLIRETFIAHSSKGVAKSVIQHRFITTAYLLFLVAEMSIDGLNY